MPQSATGQVLQPCRGRRVIDARAWACLERCRRKLDLEEVPLPVPVEEWIEGPLGIRFGFGDLSHLGPEVLGAAFVRGHEIVIDQRVLEHEGRFRFTCAHELGHVMLHRKVRSVFHENDHVGLFDSPDRYERQADRFAAAFLLPVPLLERELIRILKARNLRPGRAVIQMMNAGDESEWLWRRVVLPEITRRFGVSRTAAVHRFNDVQPIIQKPRPLLARPFVKKLLEPVADEARLDSIWVENKVATVRDLFTTEPSGERA